MRAPAAPETTAAIVGRERELEAIDRLLAADGAGPAALVLDGEAGIGKTTVWDEGVARAQRLGYLTLTCRPAESEADLPFGALGDLLDGAPAEAAGSLAEPQRAALDAALLRAPATAPLDRLAVSRACLEVLRGLAAAGPLLVAVDDVQWLDAPTASALEFALRRLDAPSARILVARRSEQERRPPLGLDRSAAHPDVLRVGPLAVADLDLILRERLDARLPRPRLVELHRLSGGNPFYAFEIVRAAVGRDGAVGDVALDVPETLGDLLRRRLDALSPVARNAALLAAASQHPSAELVERAAGGRSDGLAEAARAGILAFDGRRLRFTHPLLASVAYGSAFPAERREAHRRLAAAAFDAEERAHHLALGTDEPDERIAAELELAATRAAARGVPEAAARLAESAGRLTPADSPATARRRLAAAAEHHNASGDPSRACSLLRTLVAELPAGRDRAALLCRLADAVDDDLTQSTGLAAQALVEAEGDPAVLARAHNTLQVLVWLAGDLPGSLGHLRQAARYAEEAGDRVGLAVALGEQLYARVVLGLPLREDDAARALALEREAGELPPYQRPSFQLGTCYVNVDRLEEARPLLAGELEQVRRLGQESGIAGALYRLAELELRAGNWAAAAAAARECMTLWLQAGGEQEHACGLMIHALVQSHLGNVDEARPAAENALALSEQRGDRIMATRSRGVLGFLDLSSGRPARALEWLEPAASELRRLGVAELSIYRVTENALEAQLALGRIEDAEATIALVEEKGKLAARTWHEVVAARGRALAAAVRGDVDAAVGLAAGAVEACARLPQPFELGRTLLVQGSIERRAKRRAAAREALRAALDTFDALGAPLWAEKATEELARIPGRSRVQSAELSPTERKVAELAARGLSNKEVAAQLFLTVRTVEWNLSKVYEKLGVRSRAELARHASLAQ
jgi:DNA-binding CsgD family transcriptional regulator